MRVLFSVLLFCQALLSGGPAHAEPGRDRGREPGREGPGREVPHALSPEQEARLLERRERLRMLRQEMMRDMRAAEGGAPPPRPHPPEGGRRAAWENEPGRNWERQANEPPRPPRARREWAPEQGEPAPNRLSSEERRQLRRQMRDAAREVYGE